MGKKELGDPDSVSKHSRLERRGRREPQGKEKVALAARDTGHWYEVSNPALYVFISEGKSKESKERLLKKPRFDTRLEMKGATHAMSPHRSDKGEEWRAASAA
jgi:hypothetical protein